MRRTLWALGTIIVLMSSAAIASDYRNHETINKTADAGQLLRALLQAIAWLEAEPNNVYARNSRANIYSRFADPVMAERAIDDYSAIMASTTSTANRLNAQRARAQMYAHLQKYDNALTDLEHLFRVGPQPYLSYAVRAAAYANKGKFTEALADANEGLSLRPDHAYFHYIRGQALVGLGRYEEAIQPLEQYLKIAPANNAALWLQGFSYLRLGRKDAAASNASKLGTEVFADDPLVVYDLEKRRSTVASLLQTGRQHEANGNWQGAFSSFSSAYNWARLGGDERERLAQNDARKGYMRVFHLLPNKNYRTDHSKALINEAEAHLTNGRFDQAVLTYTKLTIWIPYLPTPYYNLALIYAQHKEFAAAATHMGTFLELEPNTPDRKALEEARTKWLAAAK